MINQLVKLSGLNEKSLKNNIQVFCVLMIYKNKNHKKKHKK
jgi:hypothetical protein